MKRCSCKSTEFSIIQNIQVKFILDGNKNVIGNEIRSPKHVRGIITCAECGKQYTDNSFEELENLT